MVRDSAEDSIWRSHARETVIDLSNGLNACVVNKFALQHHSITRITYTLLEYW